MKEGDSIETSEMRDYLRQCLEGAFDAEGFADATVDCDDETAGGFSFAIVRPSTAEVFLVTVQPAELKVYSGGTT